MKLSAFIGAALLAAGVIGAPAAEPTQRPATAPASGLEPELQALLGRIKTKLDAGAQTEDALADELKAYDALIAKYRPTKSEGVADAIYVEATLYSKVLQNYDKATQLLQTVKADYPRSRAAFAATEMLDQLDLEKESHAIQASLKPGVAFPDFAEKDIKGAPISISQYKGKVVLVDFWATWCVPCVAELPNVLAAYAKYHPKGFEIIGISLDQSADKLKSFITDKNMTWQQYFDGLGWESKLGKKYGVNSIPATYLLDGDGKIVAKNLRGPALERELERLLR